MTFADFCADAATRQRAYIEAERTRYSSLAQALHESAPEHAATADKLAVYDCANYRAAAGRLGLHPLTMAEIDERFAELDRMEREAPVRFGDNELMRMAYAANRDRLRAA